MSNFLDNNYKFLLARIISDGSKKMDRTGTGTISIFGESITHYMRDGFPLLTTKKMAWKSVVAELLWFMRGETNIQPLLKDNCNIWTGDAYKNYLKNFVPPICPPSIDVQPSFYEPMSKEMFVKSIKEENSRGDEFAEKFGNLGPIYGKQWRQWQGWMQYKDDNGKTGFGSLWYDQLARAVHDLRTNPDSRRIMVNSWNVADLDKMVLPPCHYSFQFYTHDLSLQERVDLGVKDYGVDILDFGINSDGAEDVEEMNRIIDTYGVPKRYISLLWNQRSVDTFLGLPFNIASYGLLLELVGRMVNMVPYKLVGNLGDTHLYSNHIEQAKEQMGRTSYELPSIEIDNKIDFSDDLDKILDEIKVEDIRLVNYKSHDKIVAPLSN
jgi:thymidylate synthase